MRYSLPPNLKPLIRFDGSVYSWSIAKFLLVVGTVAMAALLIMSAVTVYQISSSYLDNAYSRNAQLRAKAQAEEINKLVLDARYELEYLAGGELTGAAVIEHLSKKSPEERNKFREVAFQGKTVNERFIIVNDGTLIVSVPLEHAHAGRLGIFSRYEQFTGKPDEFIHISDPVEVIYPAVPSQGLVNSLSMHVIRLSMPVYNVGKEYRGQLTISVDLMQIRDILSLHTSVKSPLFLFPQENDLKRSFFFDSAGWLLLQSESLEDKKVELSVDKLRIGLRGDVGRPGFSTAFRPDFNNDLYWGMVSEVQSGSSGQMLAVRQFSAPSGSEKSLYLSYVPIIFEDSPQSRKIIGGIGCLDTSFMFMASTYRIAWVLTICVFISLLLVVLIMLYLGKRFARQLNILSEAVNQRVTGDDLTALMVTPLFQEIDQFQQSINNLLLHLQIARSDNLFRKGLNEEDRMRTMVSLDKEIRNSPDLDENLLSMPLEGISGGSQAIAALRQQIQKAAIVLADVLIIGETGTGKELTAEAIHKSSHRSDGPFISINCGALDENLLMDALFGHVKGAFTEASSERKGAFIAATGGTLHLDEIANASPRVQQALLRALSVRRIRPLGSDKDIPFDARIIAATNVDLLQLSLTGKFREDLYYRLAVITIYMPPLRNRKEDIIVLVKYFLEEYHAPNRNVGISRGALEKLINYDWPGNVRELKNCMIRSLAFAESDCLLPEHILFDEHLAEVELLPLKTSLPYPLGVSQGIGSSLSDNSTFSQENEQNREVISTLNPRQKKAWPYILKTGSISREMYQSLVGDSVSTRTAQYDLHDFVARRLLKKIGRGPSSRYTLK